MKVSVLIAIVLLLITISISVTYNAQLPKKSSAEGRHHYRRPINSRIDYSRHRKLKWKLLGDLKWRIKWDAAIAPLAVSLSRLKETIITSKKPNRHDDLINQVNIESSMEFIADEEELKRQFISGSCTCSSSSFSCSPTILITSSIDYFNIIRYSYYTCSSSSVCTTTCSSVSSTCSQSCTTFTALTAEYYTAYVYVTVRSGNLLRRRDDPLLEAQQTAVAAGNSAYTTSTTDATRYSTATVYSTGCEALSTACASLSVTTTLAAVVTTAAVAVAVAVGAVAIGVGAAAQAAQNIANQQQQQIQQQLALILADNGGGISAGINGNGAEIAFTPSNSLLVPVNGLNFKNFGDCGDGSILSSDDGVCYPLLRRRPCTDPRHWFILDPISLLGRCRPRLCGKDRVFVGRDGLCHDIYDPIDCRGGRRLYYTAYGDPICDCPIGQYPFPGPDDDCFSIFKRGPCPVGRVIAFLPTGALDCLPTRCGNKQNDNDQLVPLPSAGGDHRYSICQALGTPCHTLNSRHSSLFLLGYDIFKMEPVCVDVTEQDSPYYFFQDDDESTLNEEFNQLYPEFDWYRVTLIQNHANSSSNSGPSAEQRQQTGVTTGESLTAGVFQVPGSLPDPLLNPCRSADRAGNNFKCTNPIVPNVVRRAILLQAVRAAFACPQTGTAVNTILQANGNCSSTRQSASCGPSYKFDEANNQCFQSLSTSGLLTPSIQPDFN